MASPLLGQLVRFLIQLAATMALARLVAPESFGLLAILGPFQGFLIMLADPGTSAALIQRPELSRETAGQAFAAQGLLGLGLLALMSAAAAALASLYGQPPLAALGVAAGAALLFESLAVVPRSLLQRELRFVAFATIEASALAAASVAAVLWALSYPTAFALMAIPVITPLLACLGAAFTCRLAPRFPIDLIGLAQALSLARHVALANGAGYFARTADQLLVAWRWGVAPAALYSKPCEMMAGLLAQAMTPVGSLGLPLLSRGAPACRDNFVAVLRLAAYLAFPPCVAIALLSPEIIMLVLGPRWSASASVLRAASIAAMAQPALQVSGWLLVALGRGSRLWRWSALQSLIKLAAAIAGLPFGPEGVAIAYAAASLLTSAPLVRAATNGTNVRLRDVRVAVMRPVLSAAVLGAVIAAVRGLAPDMDSVAAVVLPTFLGAAALGALVIAWPSLKADLRASLRMTASQSAPRHVRAGAMRQ